MGCSGGGTDSAYSNLPPGIISPLLFRWRIIRVYQHVAEQENSEAQDMVLCTLHHIQQIAQEKDCKFSILGEVNPALEGERWGYSTHSRVHRFDRKMQEWISTSGSFEGNVEGMFTT